jgi:tetratricopeptide (TPR) repeat protein
MESRNDALDIRGKKVGSGPPQEGLPSEALTERAARLALALILVLVFLAYLNTLWFQFVHDDQFQIVQNTWLRSWRYLPRYFTGAVWAFMHPTLPGNYYRPLFLLLFRLEYMAFGLRPWAWHLCTVLMQVGVTALVYRLAVRLLRDRLAGLFAAVVFGLHPIHAEAVAWVSGITEPLLALPLISSFLCYLRRRTEHRHAQAYLVASLVLYALALLAKETALILPMIIFASELIWSAPAGTRKLHVWLHRGLAALAVITPYLVLSAAYLGLRVTALHGFQNPPESHPFLDMILTWPSVLWFYVRHLIWPVRLGPFYDVAYVTHLDIRNVVLPALAVVLIALSLWVWAKRSREAALASLWLVLPILPVLDLRVFPEGQLVHDRYLYLPSCGLALLVAWGLRRLRVGSARLLGQPALQVGLAVALGLALGVSVTRETGYFASDTTFFQHANSMLASGDAAKSNLASLLGNQGQLGEATRLYEEVWRSKPDSWEVNYNLGYAYYLQGRLPDADRLLSRAVQIDPSRPESFFYLGLTRLKLGDVNGAAADVQRAIAIRPDAEHYHFALGVILRLQGNLPGALSEFRAELELDPDNSAARQQAAEIEAAQTVGQPTAPSGSNPVPSSTPLH